MADLVLEEEAQLVQRIRAGDEVAFVSLVEAHGPEARASLRTWLFRMLLNRLRSRLRDEAHLLPFSAGFDPTTTPSEPALPADRFLAADPVTWTGGAPKKCASC